MRFKHLFLSLLILPLPGSEAGTYAPNPWLDRLTLRLCATLTVMHKQNVNAEVFRRHVQYAWDAAPLNPSWGTRKEVTIKLLCADFGEGYFDSKAVCLNKNGSIDLGEMQINSVHWMPSKFKDGRYKRSEWEVFCKEQGVEPKLTNLTASRINMKFAAHLNEIFIKYHQKTYQFSDNDDREFLYNQLCLELPKSLAEAR